MTFWTKYKGWIILVAVLIAIVCACTLECGPIIWLVLAFAWVIAAMRAEDEREHQRRRWEKATAMTTDVVINLEVTKCDLYFFYLHITKQKLRCFLSLSLLGKLFPPIFTYICSELLRIGYL